MAKGRMEGRFISFEGGGEHLRENERINNTKKNTPKKENNPPPGGGTCTNGPKVGSLRGRGG